LAKAKTTMVSEQGGGGSGSGRGGSKRRTRCSRTRGGAEEIDDLISEFWSLHARLQEMLKLDLAPLSHYSK